MALLSPLGPQFFKNDGSVAESCKLYTYATGTTTPATTYSDQAGATPHTNPIVLDTAGRVPSSKHIWLSSGTEYRYRLETSAGGLIWELDDIYGLVETPISSADSTFSQAGSGAATRTVQSKLRDTASAYDYGATGDGTADDRTALSNATAAGRFSLTPGTYRVNSNLTLSGNVDWLGGILKPASGVTITVSNPIDVGPFQLFDLSLGGTVALPRGTSVVYAEWWGAQGNGNLGIGSGAKVDNEVPINQAVAALTATSGGTYGGVIKLSRGTFYISAEIVLDDQIALEGEATYFTNIIATPSAFGSNTYMVRVQNGSSSLFNSPVKRLRINASNDANILACIYAPAWQQKSGGENLWIENFRNNGILIDTNYGGSAQLTLKQCEVFASADAASGAKCISVDASTFSVGFLTVNLEEIQCGCAVASVTFTGSLSAAATSATLASSWTKSSGAWWVLFSNGENRAVTLTNGATTATWSGGLSSGATATASAVPVSVSGISGVGRVIFNAQDVHFEQITRGFLLDTAVVLVGDSIKTDGSGTVQTVLQMSASWTGYVRASAVRKAGAANYIVDSSRGPYPLAAIEPANGLTVWPPDPTQPFASAQVNGGGGAPTLSFGVGISPSARPGAGRYTIDLSTAAASVGSYRVVVTSLDSAAPIACVVKGSASQFEVNTFAPGGAATDCGIFSVDCYHIR